MSQPGECSTCGRPGPAFEPCRYCLPKDQVIIPARAAKEAQYALNYVFPGDLVDVSLGSLATEAATLAVTNLQRQLADACRAAFEAGKDFMVGPMTDNTFETAFEPRPLWEPQTIEVQVRAGPVEPGSMDNGLPVGWTLYRVKDWQEGKVQ